MIKIFITGSSKGIGKALAEELLTKESNLVCGLSRSSSINHYNYEHISIDLSDISDVKNFNFETNDKVDKYILVNNAGMVEPVGRVGKLDNSNIEKAYNLNLIAPSILMNKFISTFESLNVDLHIINISSGAGKYPIDGWATYNSTKAGLDMFSKVLFDELNIDTKNRIHIHSVAPGIVDTEMQEIIRSKESAEFSNIEKFKEYHKNGDLNSSSNVAKKLLEIIKNPKKFNETILSVRDF